MGYGSSSQPHEPHAIQQPQTNRPVRSVLRRLVCTPCLDPNLCLDIEYTLGSGTKVTQFPTTISTKAVSTWTCDTTNCVAPGCVCSATLPGSVTLNTSDSNLAAKVVLNMIVKTTGPSASFTINVYYYCMTAINCTYNFLNVANIFYTKGTTLPFLCAITSNAGVAICSTRKYSLSISSCNGVTNPITLSATNLAIGSFGTMSVSTSNTITPSVTCVYAATDDNCKSYTPAGPMATSGVPGSFTLFFDNYNVVFTGTPLVLSLAIAKAIGIPATAINLPACKPSTTALSTEYQFSEDSGTTWQSESQFTTKFTFGSLSSDPYQKSVTISDTTVWPVGTNKVLQGRCRSFAGLDERFTQSNFEVAIQVANCEMKASATPVSPVILTKSINFGAASSGTQATPTYAENVSGCPQLLSMTLVRTDANTAIPSFITFNSSTQSFSWTVNQNIEVIKGEYNFKIMATSVGSPPIYNDSFTIKAIFKCVPTQATSPTSLPSSVTHNSNSPVPTLIDVPVFSSNCGNTMTGMKAGTLGFPIIFTVEPGIVFNSATNQIAIGQTTWTGTKTIHLNLSFNSQNDFVDDNASFFNFADVYRTISVTITADCTNQSVSISSTPATTSVQYIVGVSTSVLQPLPTYIVIPISCASPPSITFSVTREDGNPDTSFVVINSITKNAVIQTSTPMVGTFTIRVHASINAGASVDSSFTFDVVFPSAPTFLTASTWTQQTVAIDNTASFPPLAFTSDSGSVSPTLTLSYNGQTAPAWIVVTNSGISVTPPITAIGVQTFVLTATYLTVSTSVNLTFNFECQVTDVVLNSFTSTGYSFVIGGPPTVLNAPGFVVTPSACQSLVTLGWAVASASAPIVTMTAASTASVSTSDPSKVGTQTVSLVAKISVGSSTVLLTTSSRQADFQVQITASACTPLSLFATSSFATQTVAIASSPTFTAPTFGTECGAATPTLTLANAPAWVSIIGNQITITNADVSFLGAQAFTLQATSGSLSTAVVLNFIFQCQVTGISTVNQSATYQIGSPTLSSNIQYSVTPAVCQPFVSLHWEVVSVSSPLLIVSTTPTLINVQTNDSAAIGTQTVSLTGTPALQTNTVLMTQLTLAATLTVNVVTTTCTPSSFSTTALPPQQVVLQVSPVTSVTLNPVTTNCGDMYDNTVIDNATGLLANGVSITNDQLIFSVSDSAQYGTRTYTLSIGGIAESSSVISVDFICKIQSIAITPPIGMTFDLGSATTPATQQLSLNIQPQVCASLVQVAWSGFTQPFVSIDQNSLISVMATLTSQIGSHSVSIIATPLPQQYITLGTLTGTTSLSVVVSCFANTININTPSADQSYIIADPTALQISKPTFTVSPAICGASYSVQLNLGTAANLSAFVYNGTFLSVQTSNSSLMASYQLEWIATVDAQYVSGSPITSTDQFIVTLTDCALVGISVLNIPSIQAYSYAINPVNPTSLAIPIPTYQLASSLCQGQVSVQLASTDGSATFASFMTLDPVSQYVTLLTSDVTLNGVYHVKVVASSGSAVNEQFVITATLYCTVTSIGHTSVINQTYLLMGTQVQIPVSFTSTPVGCGTIALTLDVNSSGIYATSKSGFISVQNQTTLVIQSSDVSLKGQYIVNVKAAVTTTPTVVGYEDMSITFTVNLMCVVNAILPGIISATSVAAASPATNIQLSGFSILPSTCGASLQYTLSDVGVPVPLPPTVIYSANSQTGVISIESTSQTDQGLFTLQVTTSVIAPAFVDTTAVVNNIQQLPIEIVNICQLTEISSGGQVLAPMTYTLLTATSATTQIVMPFDDSISTQLGFTSFCGPKTYTIIQGYAFASILPPPTGLVDQDPWLIVVETNLFSDINLYPATLQVSLANYPQVLPVTIPFSIKIAHPCNMTTLQPISFFAMEFQIGSLAASTFTFNQILDSAAESLAQPKFCGERQYTLVDGFSFLSLSVPADPWSSALQLSLFTTDATQAGKYKGTLQVSLSSFPLAKSALIAFSVTIFPAQLNQLPSFSPKLADSVSIELTHTPQSWSFTLPSIIDPDPKDSVTLTADLGTAGNFARIIGLSSIEIDDISTGSAVTEGMHLIRLKLNDGKATVEVLFSLIVLPPQINPASTTSQTSEQEAVNNDPAQSQQTEDPLSETEIAEQALENLLAELELANEEEEQAVYASEEEAATAKAAKLQAAQNKRLAALAAIFGEGFDISSIQITADMSKAVKQAILDCKRFDWQAAFARLQELQNLKNKAKQPVPPSPFIKEIKSDGKIKIGFRSDIYVVPNLQLINNGTVIVNENSVYHRKMQDWDDRRLAGKNTLKKLPVLEVQVFAGIESNPENLQFTWNVTSQKESELEVQLYFQTPGSVSANRVSNKPMLMICRIPTEQM